MSNGQKHVYPTKNNIPHLKLSRIIDLDKSIKISISNGKNSKFKYEKVNKIFQNIDHNYPVLDTKIMPYTGKLNKPELQMRFHDAHYTFLDIPKFKYMRSYIPNPDNYPFMQSKATILFTDQKILSKNAVISISAHPVVKDFMPSQEGRHNFKSGEILLMNESNKDVYSSIYKYHYFELPERYVKENNIVQIYVCSHIIFEGKVDQIFQNTKDNYPVLNTNIIPLTAKLNLSELKEESFPELNRLIKLLNDNPTINIEIAGHTDNIGSDSDNSELSKNRAASVVAYLTKGGIKANRLTSQGFGETKPVASNETEEGKQLNRRVEFMVTSK